MSIRTSRTLKLTAILGVLLIAGCASDGAKPEKSTTKTPAAAQPVATAAAKPAPTPAISAPGKDEGTVIFFRDTRFAGSAIRYKVRENNVVLGKLSRATYFVVNLSKGPHQFEVHSEAKDVLNMEVEPGETYYFQGTLSLGFMAGHPHLEPSTAAVFDSMKSKLKDSALTNSK